MLLSNQSNQICLTTRAPRLLQVGKTFKTFNTHKTNKRYMYTLLITRDVAFLFIYLCIKTFWESKLFLTAFDCSEWMRVTMHDSLSPSLSDCLNVCV